MEVPRPAPASPDLAATRSWRIGRASLGFILDIIAISRRSGGDILDPLILLVILVVNIGPISQDLELQRRYAGVDDAPPEDLRRPVSVSAVAASLRLPYETVRRRVARLAKRGDCVITREGVLIPASAVNNSVFLAIAIARYERLKEFYFEMKALGAFTTLPAPYDPRPIEGPPVRLANRTISEYFLRVVDGSMRLIGDPVAGFLLLELTRANAEHISPADQAFEGPLPDMMRRPIRAYALARRVGLPSETVRRHLVKLDEAGLCKRTDGGLLAVLEPLGRPANGPPGLSENLQNLQRLFSKLAVLGVIAFWEQENAPADSAS